MIDTDKYEGHGPVPWKWERNHIFCTIEYKGEKKLAPIAQWVSTRIADAELMADAPLLLAEVKRLREQLAKANKFVYSICQHSDSMLMDYEDYMKGDEEE